MEEKIQLELSRYCVPFTPFRKRLEESAICLVTSAAIYHQADEPFNPEGDESFRVIPGGAPTSELRYCDTHYDHACIDQDLNCVFPIDRLHELGHEKRVGGPSERHFSIGFTQALRKLRDTTVPALAKEVEQARPDAVLLTGG
ncbi:MAG: hypothetical protein HY901_00490 [Deltaproteobacteria bacterium]|nr:hypothetical protein [Deltaproteobacteria bacterium]